MILEGGHLPQTTVGRRLENITVGIDDTHIIPFHVLFILPIRTEREEGRDHVFQSFELLFGWDDTVDCNFHFETPL
ncbi:hypothetical protein D3C80_1836240 [compost metagenome]